MARPLEVKEKIPYNDKSSRTIFKEVVRLKRPKKSRGKPPAPGCCLPVWVGILLIVLLCVACLVAAYHILIAVPRHGMDQLREQASPQSSLPAPTAPSGPCHIQSYLRTALILLTPPLEDSSLTILNRPSSPVVFTCGPPQISRLKGAIEYTLTLFP